MTTTVTRSIIHIDEDKCNGCGQCVSACHEGALQLIDGKARLVRDDYCDGLGACLGECPQDAIRIEEREAVPFDEAAVAARETAMHEEPACDCPSVAAMLADLSGHKEAACGCPSAQARTLTPQAACAGAETPPSALANWPTQLKLVPVQAPYLQGADLLISADCVPFAYAGFHQNLLPGKVVLQACPKLDDAAAYRDKLTAMFAANDIHSVTVARMEVPCCGALATIVQGALAAAQSQAPVRVVTVGIDGEIIDAGTAAPAVHGGMAEG